MSKKNQVDVIKELQYNDDFVILNNPLSAPKLVRKLTRKQEVQPSEIYVPKLFYDIISKLTPDHLEEIAKGKDAITITINIKDFLKSIDAGGSKNFYNHVIACVDILQSTQVKWSDDKKSYGTAIITHYEHIRGSGKINIVLYKEFVKKVLEVGQSEHFSFLKMHLHRLQNASAIKLFPYFVSWRNRGIVEISLDTFKKKFAYDTEGYAKFSNLKLKVIEPALQEINDKTELIIKYEPLGVNLKGIRPRVSGLQFSIQEKNKHKIEPLLNVGSKTIPNSPSKPIAQPIPIDKPPKIALSDTKYQQYDSIADFWGVDKAIFKKFAVDRTEKEIQEAIEYTKSQMKLGKADRPAGVFIDALKNRYKSAEETVKSVQQKKTKEAAEKKAQIEAQKLPLMTDLNQTRKDFEAKKNKIIAVIVKQELNATETIYEHLKTALPLIFWDKTLADCRQNPMLRAIFKSEFERIYPTYFVAIKEEYEPKIQELKLAITKLERQ